MAGGRGKGRGIDSAADDGRGDRTRDSWREGAGGEIWEETVHSRAIAHGGRGVSRSPT